jgi:transposase
VIKWEIRVLLAHYLDQGLSKSAIARHLGIDRRTITRWIETGQLDREVDTGQVPRPVRRTRPSKLDPYKPIIDQRLATYPALSAVRLLEEIRAAGYIGGISQLRVYLQSARPKDVPETVVRFETEPGQQGQVDFAEVVMPWGKRFALLVVLGYSRLLWARFFTQQDMRTLFQGLEEAFTFFGGVPRELLFDQMASVITRDLRPLGGKLIENAEFLRFAAHWGFRVRACRPYRAKTKGKVERPIRYLRDSFLYGREFVSDDDLNAQADTWLQSTANVRIHSTTKLRPLHRFTQEEQTVLLPLAGRSYRSLVLLPSSSGEAPPPVPRIQVERRPLRTYARIAAGAR